MEPVYIYVDEDADNVTILAETPTVEELQSSFGLFLQIEVIRENEILVRKGIVNEADESSDTEEDELDWELVIRK